MIEVSEIDRVGNQVRNTYGLISSEITYRTVVLQYRTKNRVEGYHSKKGYGGKQKGSSLSTRALDMAGVERFELPTRGFGIRCSANWSYTPKISIL